MTFNFPKKMPKEWFEAFEKGQPVQLGKNRKNQSVFGNPHDPPGTFGNEVVGALAAYTDGIDGSWFTCPPDAGKAVSITARLVQYDTLTPKVKYALYNKFDNSLVGYTEEWTLTNGWADWKTLNIISGGTLAPIDYWLVIFKSEYILLAYKTETDKGAWQDVAYNNFPDPWSPTLVDEKLSIYCTYSPWTRRVSGVSDPAKVMGVANISKVKGVS